MDWNSVKTWVHSLSSKITPVFQKVRESGKNIGSFIERQFYSTGLFLRKIDEYESLQSSKKVVLIAVSQRSDASRFFINRYVLYAKDAWTMNTKLRFIDIGANPEIASELSIDNEPTMIVFYHGFEYKRYIGIDAIQKWWSDPSFYDDTTLSITSWNPVSQSQLHSIDPLKEAGTMQEENIRSTHLKKEKRTGENMQQKVVKWKKSSVSSKRSLHPNKNSWSMINKKIPDISKSSSTETKKKANSKNVS